MTVDVPVRGDFPRRVREIENTWIPMPDGTRLAARIWLPDDAEEFTVPAILEYLPYRKRDGTVRRDHLTHPYFAGFGYAGVRVDMRGTGDSEGVCKGEYLLQEQDDCLSVIEWLAEQPWCSGNVGMIGISWGGFNGLQVAARRPDHLCAVISLCSTDDRYADDIHFMGGAVLTDKLSWGATAFTICNTPPDPALVGDRWRDMWQERLEGNGLWMLDWFRHQRRDEFYAHGSVCEDYSAIEVPVYLVGGWMDGYTNTIFRMLDRLPGPKKGLVGPWAHKYPHFANPGPRIGFLQECLRWWDQHLKGIDTGIMDEPILRAWLRDRMAPSPHAVESSGCWVAEPSWIGMAVATHRLHPTGSGRLSESPSEFQFEIDSPQNAGHTAGSWCGYGEMADGPLDQNGESGLMTMFESEPVPADCDLLGLPEFKADVVCDRKQALLVAVLSVVADDGKASQVSYGILNLTHRNSHSNPEPMPIGRPVSVRVQLNACGQRVRAGQRLRLAISNAYWPVVWPAQSGSRLKLTNASLDLPVRPARDLDSSLLPFDDPESAAPLETRVHKEGEYRRTRCTDCASGIETCERMADSGLEEHLHTGIKTRSVKHETFTIKPDEPGSATGSAHWSAHYSRGGWMAELKTAVKVEALPDTWRIRGTLLAKDQDGEVCLREFAEDIRRDLV